MGEYFIRMSDTDKIFLQIVDRHAKGVRNPNWSSVNYLSLLVSFLLVIIKSAWSLARKDYRWAFTNISRTFFRVQQNCFFYNLARISQCLREHISHMSSTMDRWEVRKIFNHLIILSLWQKIRQISNVFIHFILIWSIQWGFNMQLQEFSFKYMSLKIVWKSYPKNFVSS